MALVKCPECGRENVSDTAESCPSCGYSIKRYFDNIKEEEKRIQEEKIRLEKIEAEKIRKKETEKERQKEKIEQLEKEHAQASKEIKKSAIGLLVSVPLLILFWNYSERGSLGFLIVITAFAVFVSFVFFVNGIQTQNRSEQDLEVVKRSIDEYDELVVKRIKTDMAVYQEYAKKADAKHPMCPACGSRNTERISTLNRTLSVATVGLASSKIGKQYQCKNCKHKW